MLTINASIIKLECVKHIIYYAYIGIKKERFRIILGLGLNACDITALKKQHLKLNLSCKEKQVSIFNDSETKPNPFQSDQIHVPIYILLVRHAMFISNNVHDKH